MNTQDVRILNEQGKPIYFQARKFMGAVTPSNSTIFSSGYVLHLSVDMTLAVVLEDDDAATGVVLTLTAGWQPMKVKMVLSTGTNVNGGVINAFT